MVLEVSKVSPGIWKRVVSDSFSELNSRERRLADALLVFGQNRHVGITPKLSRSIALSILNAEQSAPRPPWDSVSKRLLQQVDCLEKGRTDLDERVNRGRRQVGILRSAPVYLLLRVVIPIVEMATRKLGKAILFTESDNEESPSLSEYGEYEEALSNSIDDISRDTDRSTDLFWSERAAILSGYLKFRRSKENEGGRLLEMDAPGLAYLLRLNPRVRSMPENDKQIQLPESEPQIQQIQKQREGGVNGIKITRSLDDISAVLHSELANPDVMLTDKLVNEGYMIYERNPKKQENRDVLVVGLMSPDISSANTLGWLKACWFETMARLSLILLKAKLTKSDLDWIHADRSGNWRPMHYPIQRMTDTANDTESYSKWYRGHFLTAMNWLPDFLSVDASLPIPRSRKQANGDDVDTSETTIAVGMDEDRWVEDAWRNYVEKRVRTEPDSNTTDGWTSQYRYIHVMIFLPLSDQMKGDAPSATINRYLHQLHLSAQSKRHVSIVWVPESFQRIEGLSSWFSGGILHLENRMSHTAHDEGVVTSWLVSGWLKNLIKEIWNG
ncbi:MAG: hypothetical protein HN996_12340 [Opitutae bacterium]|jgi:hypothetical protein|nr:hypothetical protein [Opitutae bacterium]MBT5692122.1 hypothetical protein [Opitutae bacterium]MBT6959206.1 hypothetical protein [Opitutae bacterium]